LLGGDARGTGSKTDGHGQYGYGFAADARDEARADSGTGTRCGGTSTTGAPGSHGSTGCGAPGPAAEKADQAATDTATSTGYRAEYRSRSSHRQERNHRAEFGLTGLDARPEVLTPVASAQMGSQGTPAQDPAITVGDRSADISAVHRASLLHDLQSLPGLVEGLAAGGRARPHRFGYVVEAEVVELAHHENGALTLRQLGDVAEHLSQPFLACDLRLDALSGGRFGSLECLRRPVRAQEIDALVVRHTKQPRLQPYLPAVSRQ
jgi:hypothetical protein